MGDVNELRSRPPEDISIRHGVKRCLSIQHHKVISFLILFQSLEVALISNTSSHRPGPISCLTLSSVQLSCSVDVRGFFGAVWPSCVPVIEDLLPRLRKINMAPRRQHIPITPSIAPTAMPAFAPGERSLVLATNVADELAVDNVPEDVATSAGVAAAVEELLAVVEANM